MFIDSCKLGKFGAVVQVETPNINQIAAALCQHIVGMNPTEIGTPPEHKPQQKGDKKKKKGNEDEVNKTTEEEEETQLLRQEFILDPSLTVQQYLEANSPRVVDFVRFECGEVLPGDEDS